MKRSSLATMDSCAFCPTIADLTGEHLFSNWTNRMYTLRRYTVRSINIKAVVVCGKCNNGWMSDLENNHAKPAMKDVILHGSPCLLQSRDIASIAKFAFKTAVVADHMHATRKPFFSPAIRYSFAKSLTIPDGVQMWLGAFDGRHARSGSITARYLKKNVSVLRGFEFYVVTYITGHLAFQVLARITTSAHGSGTLGDLSGLMTSGKSTNGPHVV
jgi:hypothetical protein